MRVMTASMCCNDTQNMSTLPSVVFSQVKVGSRDKQAPPTPQMYALLALYNTEVFCITAMSVSGLRLFGVVITIGGVGMVKKRDRDAERFGGGRRRPMLDLGGRSFSARERVEDEEAAEEDTQSPQVQQGEGEWLEAMDQESGDTYYWHSITGETTWEKPGAKDSSGGAAEEAEAEAEPAGQSPAAGVANEAVVPGKGDKSSEVSTSKGSEKNVDVADAAKKKHEAAVENPKSKKEEKDDGVLGGLSLLGGYGSDSDGSDDANDNAGDASVPLTQEWGVDESQESNAESNAAKETDKDNGKQSPDTSAGDASAGEAQLEAPKQPVKLMLLKPRQTMVKLPATNVFAKKKAAAQAPPQPREYDPAADVDSDSEEAASAPGAASQQPAEKKIEGRGNAGFEDVDEFLREVEVLKKAPAGNPSGGHGAKVHSQPADTSATAIAGNTGNEDPDVDEFLNELNNHKAALPARPAPGTKCNSCGQIVPTATGGQVEQSSHGHTAAGAAEQKQASRDANGESEMEGKWVSECGAELLALREGGHTLVSRLKHAVVNEEILANGRRDVLLTILGGMLSWSGTIVELGTLVATEQSDVLSQSVMKLLPKIKERLKKCEDAMADQLAQRCEDHVQVLPAGWVRVVTTEDGRVMYVKEDSGIAQSHPPTGTTLSTITAEAQQEVEPGEVVEEKEWQQIPDAGTQSKTTGQVTEEMEALCKALPPGDGNVVHDSLLLYFQPDSDCSGPSVQRLFLDRRVMSIRIMGSGFAAITFVDSLECELARWQVLTTLRGVSTHKGSVKDWVVFSVIPCLAYGRAATDKDAIQRYPITHTADQHNEPPPQFTTAPPQQVAVPHAVAAGNPAMSSSPYEPAIMAGGSPYREDSYDSDAVATPGRLPQPESNSATVVAGAKVKVSNSKVKSGKLTQQMQKWKTKRSELEVVDESDYPPNSVEALELKRKREAEEWFTSQVASGAVGDDNPNFIPIRKITKLV